MKIIFSKKLRTLLSGLIFATLSLSATSLFAQGKAKSNVEFAESLTIGWNLGNTMDADTETGWGMPKTTREMIHAVKEAGFKTIRIPVSWSKHVKQSGNEYFIDLTWMGRVKQIVDWSLDEGLYVIINVHHDNYFAGKSTANLKGLKDSSVYGYAISTDPALQTKSKDYLRSVWKQIATAFASYDERLIFEVLNEPRQVGEATEWNHYSTDACKPYCDVITAYEQVCIDVIRSVKGNEKRYLMAPGYAGSGASPVMLKAFTLPKDPVNRLLLSVHAYSPYEFAMANADATFDKNDQASLDSMFAYLKTTYTDKGIGVVMGEASASNKDNTAEREKWTRYYFGKAKEARIPVILWDNMVETPDFELNGEHHGWLHRKSGTWFFPSIIKTMMDTVGIKGYKIPEYVKPAALTPASVGWSDKKAKNLTVSKIGNLAWDQDSNTMAKSCFQNVKKGSVLKITFAAPGAVIKIRNPDWQTYASGTIVNGTADGDDVITVSTTELYYSLTAADAAIWKNTSISVSGQSGTIKEIKLME